MKAISRVAVATVLWTLGCSDAAGTNPDGNGGLLPDGGRAPSSLDGSAGDTGRPPPVSTPDAGPPALNPDAACGTVTADTTRVPVNLLIALDRSGSMRDDDKWTAAVNGLRRLVMLLSDETRVGVVLFPGNNYSMPTVPVAPLSTSRAQILDLLMRTEPSGGTPMACALQGAHEYYDAVPASLDGSRNVILITDGEPRSDCGGAPAVHEAVTAMAMGTPSVHTYVVGTPDAADSFLSEVAVHGLTQRSSTCVPTNTCHYSLQNASFEADLNTALDDIRGRAGSCEVRVNADPNQVDPTQVNVNYTPAPGAAPQLIPRDRAHSNGWDYSPDMRTIILYGPSCDTYRGSQTGTLQILFGCPTVAPG